MHPLHSQLTSPGTSGADNRSIRISVPPLLTIDEAAQVLTISKRKACDLIASGKLRTVRIGRRRIVPRESIERVTGIKLS